jgi:hypothetical protein
MVAWGRQEQPIGANAVLLASNRKIPKAANTENSYWTTLSQPTLESFSENAQVLRDDYAPADQLLTTP